ncbi:hypothetical protein LCGC14_2119570, partial [marine sediment metagenome]
MLISALDSMGNSSVDRKVSHSLTIAGIEGPDLQSRIRSIAYQQRHLLDELGRVLAYDFQEYAASVQPYLTSEQIRDLIRDGFSIGAHSVDHPLYSALSLTEQLNQTWGSLHSMSKQFQYTCQAFAFP